MGQVLLCALSMASVSVLHTDLGGQSVGGKAAMVGVEETMVGEVEVMEVVVVEQTVEVEDMEMVEEVTREGGDGLGMVEEVPMVLVEEVVGQQGVEEVVGVAAMAVEEEEGHAMAAGGR